MTNQRVYGKRNWQTEPAQNTNASVFKKKEESVGEERGKGWARFLSMQL